MNKKRIGIVFGGRSGEHEVSLMSAASISEAIDKEKYDVVPIYITKQGKWLPPSSAEAVLASGKLIDEEERVAIVGDPTYEYLVRLTKEHEGAGLPDGKVDVIFPVLHGTYGEDGTIQGLLELANIPYVGAGVMASAVGMDKEMMKDIFRAKGLPVVDYVVIRRSQWEHDPDKVFEQVEQSLTYPVFVKPSNLGSSVGISKVKSDKQLREALDTACLYDRKVLIEAGVECREIECSVLGNERPIASEVGEIIPANEFYDYEAKYFDNSTKLDIPAKINSEVKDRVKFLSIEAFAALDCSGMARVDFFLCKKTGKLFLNELNTIPGFTKMSMYPRLWKASGLNYKDLIDKLLDLAVKKHQDKNRSKTDF